jgi:hypothetical protein
MIHDLTIGHLDPAGVPERRRTVLKPLELAIVARLLKELGETDSEGNPTLDGAGVQFEDGYVVVPWLGGRTNRKSEEFALRMGRETGCLIADVGHRRIVEPEQLPGLAGSVADARGARGR